MEIINMERFYDERTMLVMQYVIVDDNLWINYDWLTKELKHSEQYMEFHYRNKVNPLDKRIIKVIDEDDWGYETKDEHRFISRFAAHDLINKHIERIGEIEKCLNNLESSLGLLEDNQDLKIDIELMFSEAHSSNEDFDELVKRVDKVYKSPIIQDIVNRKDIEDKDHEFEKVLDDLREINKSKGISNINVETDDSKQIKYTKHKKLENSIEPPEWLKELL